MKKREKRSAVEPAEPAAADPAAVPEAAPAGAGGSRSRSGRAADPAPRTGWGELGETDGKLRVGAGTNEVPAWIAGRAAASGMRGGREAVSPALTVGGKEPAGGALATGAGADSEGRDGAAVEGAPRAGWPVGFAAVGLGVTRFPTTGTCLSGAATRSAALAAARAAPVTVEITGAAVSWTTLVTGCATCVTVVVACETV
jgi:hypothetical protein